MGDGTDDRMYRSLTRSPNHARHTTRTESTRQRGGPTCMHYMLRLKRTAATSRSRLELAHRHMPAHQVGVPLYGALEGCGDQGGLGLAIDDTTTLCTYDDFRSCTLDTCRLGLSLSLSLSLSRCSVSRLLLFLVAIPLFPNDCSTILSLQSYVVYYLVVLILRAAEKRMHNIGEMCERIRE